MFVASLYNLKGGVGKTASCVNFAYMAARDGFRTLLWDLDPQGASSFYFNASPAFKAIAKKIVSQEVPLHDAALQTDYDNLDIIPADISARKLDLLLQENNGSKKQIAHLLRPIADQYDFVFIDCPPGFSTLADNIFFASDAVLMPVIPTTLSIRTYEIVKQYFEEKMLGVDKLMCFFTLVDMRKKMHGEVMQELYKDKRFFEYYIPYLSDVEKMGSFRAPVESFSPSSYATVCYRALWNEIKEGILT
ncbi:MAG: ParA family protein [Bacteroidetes bacterium]|nr:ParA family protein [Bacteroidota bacterium]